MWGTCGMVSLAWHIRTMAQQAGAGTHTLEGNGQKMINSFFPHRDSNPGLRCEKPRS